MNTVHIVGRQNSGKTTLICELVPELVALNYKVGTLKHSGHNHELDRPGKDSYRHFHAGANPSAIVTPQQIAIFTTPNGNPLSQLTCCFSHCEFVLVEGFIEAEGPKIEVWRKTVGVEPLARERADILAVVSDDDISLPILMLFRKDIKAIVRYLIGLFPEL